MKVCNEYRLLINLYIDGELDADAARAVEAHLSICPACRRYCDEICMVNRAVQDVRIPGDLHSHIMAAVSAEQAAAEKVIPFPEAEKNTQPVQKKRHPSRRWIGTVAAVLAVACIGVFGMEGGLAFVFSSVGSAEPESAPMKAEMADSTARQENTKSTAAGVGKVTAESAAEAESLPEAEEVQPGEQLPIRIEEAMASWFTDSADHVTVLDNGMPMMLTDPETGKEDPADGADAQKDQNNENPPVLTEEYLNELDALLGEAADGYGFCLVAAGPGEQLPAIFADQAGETDPGYTLVITVRNDASVHDQICTSLKDSGFEIHEDADGSRFVLDPDAREGLVVIELTQ